MNKPVAPVSDAIRAGGPTGRGLSVSSSDVLEALSGVIPGGIYIADAFDNIIFTNDKFHDISGMAKTGANTMADWDACIHPDDVARAVDDWRAGVKSGGSEVEYRFRHKDGRVVWALDRASAFDTDENGHASRMIGTLTDITELKTREAELEAAKSAAQAAEQRLTAILTDQTELIQRFTTDGTLTYVNAAYCRFFGRSEDDLIGSNWIDERPENEREMRRRHLAKTPAGDSISIDVLLRRHDGEDRWIQWTDRALMDQDGSVVEIQAVGRDITEHKLSAERLVRSEERFQLAVLGSADGLWDGDLVTGEIYMSPRLKAMIGYEPDEYPDSFEAFRNSLHPEDLEPTVQAFRRHLADDTPYKVQYRLRCKDGSYRWFRSKAQALRDEDGNALRVAGSVSDISELKQREAELEAERARAEEANRLKSEFLANVSHEIRTPLNGLLGMTQLLNRDGLNPQQATHVETIENCGRALLAILSDVLDVSKIETGLVEINERPFEMEQLVHEAVDTVKGIAFGKGLAVSANVVTGAQGQFIGDEDHIRQVLINLAGNAIKFTDTGTVAITVEQTPDGRFRFAVSDEGPGVPADQHAVIFERFRQADGSNKRKYGGMGLGLAISKNLVELMGGEIGVDSVVGKGATFRFTLPLREAGEAPLPAEEAAQPATRITSAARADSRAKILLAEDNHINRQLVIAALGSRLDAEIVTAENGAEALERLSEQRFDLVLMDIQMPVMTGEDAIRAIRGSGETHADVPIIALTASALAGDRESFLNLGASDYLSKPLDIDLLARTVNRHLRGPADDSPAHGRGLHGPLGRTSRMEMR